MDVGMTVAVAVKMAVIMRVGMAVGVAEVVTTPAAEKHVSAKAGDGQSGKYAQPRVKLLGHDVARGIEGDGAQRKYSRGMRGSDD